MCMMVGSVVTRDSILYSLIAKKLIFFGMKSNEKLRREKLGRI